MRVLLRLLPGTLLTRQDLSIRSNQHLLIDAHDPALGPLDGFKFTSWCMGTGDLQLEASGWLVVAWTLLTSRPVTFKR